MNQINISLQMKGGFKSLGIAKAHREIVSKAVELREAAEGTADYLKQVDAVDVDSSNRVSSLGDGDLDPRAGKVIVLGNNDDGTVGGGSLSFNPETGEAYHLEAETPEGKLTRSGVEKPGESLSPTFKWETGEGSETSTTYFKFDDEKGVLSVLDTSNEIPAFFGGLDGKEVKELVNGTFQGGIPIIVDSSALGSLPPSSLILPGAGGRGSSIFG